MRQSPLHTALALALAGNLALAQNPPPQAPPPYVSPNPPMVLPPGGYPPFNHQATQPQNAPQAQEGGNA